MKRDVNHFAIIMPKDILREDFKDLTNVFKENKGNICRVYKRSYLRI